jgi:hypothetical protein
VRLDSVTRAGTSMRAHITPLPETFERTLEVDAHVRRIQELIDKTLSLASGLSEELRGLVMTIDDPLRLVYVLATLLDLRPPDKQAILEENDLVKKLQDVATALTREVSLLELKGKIESQAQQEMTDAQRQYFLRQQMKAIQQELGEGEGAELVELRARIDAANLPESILHVATREVERLSRMTGPVAGIPDDPDVSRLDPGASVVGDHRRPPRSGGSAPRARRRPLRPRQGQGAHRRVPRGPEAQGRHEGPDSLLRRAARRGQDVAGPVDRPGDEPQVRAHLARRRARRGGDPRPPPHLHRLDPGTDRARRSSRPAR